MCFFFFFLSCSFIYMIEREQELTSSQNNTMSFKYHRPKVIRGYAILNRERLRLRQTKQPHKLTILSYVLRMSKPMLFRTTPRHSTVWSSDKRVILSPVRNGNGEEGVIAK